MKPGDLVHVIQQRGTGYYARFHDRGVGIIVRVENENRGLFPDLEVNLGLWIHVKLVDGVGRFHESSCSLLPAPSHRN